MASSQPPRYDPTYTLHRLPPFHVDLKSHFQSQASLDTHARRLADALRGDVLRGIHNVLGDQEDGLPRAGRLQKVQWSLSIKGGNDTEQPGPDGMGLAEGITVKLEYENTTYLALLLRNSAAVSERPGEAQFPLLVSRMPVGVRKTLLDYLANAFDARAEPLQLSSQLVGRALEGFVDETSRHEHGLQDTLKDIQLSMGFRAPIRNSLRSMDITLKRDDLPGFLQQGKTQARAALRQTGKKEVFGGHGPFMGAICQYLSNHLALDLSHRDVYIARVACGAFALNCEGKVKIFAPAFPGLDETLEPNEYAVRKGVSRLVELLLAAAAGEPT